eukprot:gnl/MRDRNA2_/MRDRNA2_87774_c0_seq1.p1 gnl/MRDRNA2_/MRDRNA2_87774_c0~~gnl/MRDRNA2_/MRDRNA2_87774_c0_seq1.p1  ORF type:complete len:249 (-),score=36.55 gnl/MRDRNA2_/MRDRNA2_87774_c0_seq1:27-773(-)
MQKLKRLNHFCCGCSLNFGVQAILATHLLQAIFYIYTSASNVVFRVATFNAFVNPTTQIFTGIFCLAGLPFILVGWLGVLWRNREFLQMYLYYLIVTFAFATIYLTIWHANHHRLPGCHPGETAFTCGVSRVIDYGIVAVYLAFQMYCIFAVWSLVDDFLIGGSEPVFTDLLAGAGGKEAAREAVHQSLKQVPDVISHDRQWHDQDVAGFSDKQRVPFPAVYGSVITGGLGTSSGIFGGLWGFSRHEW